MKIISVAFSSFAMTEREHMGPNHFSQFKNVINRHQRNESESESESESVTCQDVEGDEIFFIKN